jgi:hypothetical protein
MLMLYGVRDSAAAGSIYIYICDVSLADAAALLL